MKKLCLCAATMLAAGICAGGSADVPFRTGEVFGKAVKVAEGAAGFGRCVNIEGDFLYVGGKETLGVYSLSGDPLHPKLLGETKDIASARQIALQGGMAYVSARANGIWIVDCRSPAKPLVAGHYPSTANCTGIDVAGDVCFVGGSKSGLEFIDVSRPQNPQLIRCVKKEPVESQSVAYRDGLLFSGEWGGKCVTIWDARDMKSLKRLACCALESNGDGVWMDGKWLYASTGFSKEDKAPGAKAHPGQMGLEIYDVENPHAPKKVSRVDFEYCKPCTYDMWLVRVAEGMAFCTVLLSFAYFLISAIRAERIFFCSFVSCEAGCFNSTADCDFRSGFRLLSLFLNPIRCTSFCLYEFLFQTIVFNLMFDTLIDVCSPIVPLSGPFEILDHVSRLFFQKDPVFTVQSAENRRGSTHAHCNDSSRQTESTSGEKEHRRTDHKSDTKTNYLSFSKACNEFFLDVIQVFRYLYIMCYV